VSKQFLDGADIISMLQQLSCIEWKGGALWRLGAIRFRPALTKPDRQFSLHPAFQHSMYSGISMVGSMAGMA
jgi:hypothetical protein